MQRKHSNGPMVFLDFCILNRNAVEAQMEGPRGKPKGPHMKELQRLEQELVNGSMTLKAKNGAVKVLTAKELGGRPVPEAAGQGTAALENIYGPRGTGTGYVAAMTVDEAEQMVAKAATGEGEVSKEEAQKVLISAMASAQVQQQMEAMQKQQEMQEEVFAKQAEAQKMAQEARRQREAGMIEPEPEPQEGQQKPLFTFNSYKSALNASPPTTPVASVGQGSSSAGNSAGELATRKLGEEVEGMRDDMAKMGNMVADLSAAMGKFMGRPNE